jgi:dihydroorotase
LGTLEIGGPADITLFDPNLEWLVEPAKFASRGKNTPLEGTTLKGKVRMTIYQGKIVWSE